MAFGRLKATTWRRSPSLPRDGKGDPELDYPELTGPYLTGIQLVNLNLEARLRVLKRFKSSSTYFIGKTITV